MNTIEVVRIPANSRVPQLFYNILIGSLKEEEGCATRRCLAFGPPPSGPTKTIQAVLPNTPTGLYRGHFNVKNPP